MPPSVRRLPYAPGVYRFRDAAGRTLYIGRATELRARVASYWSGLRDRPRLRRMIPAIDRVEAAVCDSVHEAAWLERNLLSGRLPRFNRARGGQESPVHIRLDPGPAAPGLRVLYHAEPGCFGPYLGGARTRQAIAALHRIRPLAYTAARLTGAARDMAAKRGVTTADRAALTASLAAVLGREPAAVAQARADLIDLRDRASANLAFELAAQLHEELQAFDWITGPQRATTLDRADFAAAGWSDGTLVLFTVRAGSVTDWSQRPCGEAQAAGHLDATPPGWRDFAQRNAELAAAIR